MAITIRNKLVEEHLRQLGRENGEGPSATIARLVADELRRLTEVERLELTRRRHAMAELMRLVPEFTEEDKAEMDRAMEDMYDQAGVPR